MLTPFLFWAQCNFTVNAGPDDNLCAPGGEVQLNGTISAPYLFSTWTPPINLSNPTILDPIASITATTTYTLAGWAIDPSSPELIENADFQAGNTAFTSEYTYGDPNDPLSLFPEATYSVLTSPADVHSNFPACDDHTLGNGTGLMMVVNGSGDVNVNVWCQSIDVEADTYYNLGAWIATVVPVAPASLQFSINGILVGSIFNASFTPCLWEEFDANWYSTTTGSVDFCITNQNTALSGNDFALDDLSFKALCKVEDEVTISVTENPSEYITEVICPGDFYQLGNYFFDTPGSYFDIEVYDSDGCLQLYDLDLELIEIFIQDVVEAELTCLQDTVEISVDALTSNGVLFYDWSAITGNIISNHSQSFVLVDQIGTYQVVITAEYDGEICDETIILTVTESISDPTAIAGPDGTIDCNSDMFQLDGSGSTTGANIAYTWTNDAGSIVSNNLSQIVTTSGMYTLTVTDLLTGCMSTDIASVIVQNTPPTVSAGPDGILDCANLSFELNSSSSSTGSEFTYTWRNSNGELLSNDLTQFINTADTYSLTIVNNNTGCIASDTAVVTASTEFPDVDAGVDVVLDCGIPDFLIQPTINNINPNITATWSTINGNILNNMDDDVLVNQSGDYVIVAVDTTTSCEGTDTVHVTFTQDLPDLTIDIPDTITCIQSSVNIYGHFLGDPTIVDFTWSTLEGNFTWINDSIIMATSPGEYTISVHDPIHNCSNSASVMVFENVGEPIAHAGTNDVINCSDTLSLNGSLSSLGPDYMYLWTTTDGHIVSGEQSINPQVDQAGMYVLTVTDIRNGCSTSDNVTITSNQSLPDVFIQSPGILNCNQSILTLSGSSSNMSDPLSFSWTTSDGNIISDTTINSIRIDQGGNYTLRVLNQLTNCSNSASVLVTEDIVHPTIDAGPEMTLLCGQPIVQLDGSILENRPVQISWTFTDGNIVSGDQTLSPMVDRPGTYYVTAEFDNGCTTIDSVRVLIDQDLPQAIIEEAFPLNCIVQEQVLDATLSSEGSQYLASWSLSNGSFADLSSIYMPTINSGGTYILEVLNTTNNCVAYDTVQVGIDTISPIINMTANDLNCIDTLAVLDASLSTGLNDITYLWTGTNIDPNQTGSAIVTTTEPGLYHLEIVDDINGCIAEREVRISEDFNVSGFNIGLPALYETELGQEIQLNASINFDPNLISSITWSDTSTLKDHTQLNPIACPDTDTGYQLFISINDNCHISATTRVRIIEPDIYIPDTFTPDGDGTNDGFTLFSEGNVLQIDKMLIVNRWGDIVFNQSNILPNNPSLGWDGSYKGVKQPTGVYVYFIQVRFSNNQVKIFSGDVTSLR